MFAETAKSILEFLKLAPRYLVGVAIFAGFLLFSPESILQGIGVVEFTQSNRSTLGIVFIASVAFFTVSVFIEIIRWVKGCWRRRREFYRITKRLHRLTEGEKQILRFYFAENTRANTLRIEDGIVQELVAERIIYRSASLGSLVDGFAHNISDIAWDYLYVHPQLLEGTTNIYRTDKKSSFW